MKKASAFSVYLSDFRFFLRHLPRNTYPVFINIGIFGMSSAVS